MPTYRYLVANERNEPFPPVDTLPIVDADEPMAAVAKLAQDGKLPTTGPPFGVRVVTAVHPNGVPDKVLSVPLTPEFKIPLDWQPPDDVGPLH
jgi:hypothetical protein